MPRHECMRKIRSLPGTRYFKPPGIPLSELDEIIISFDEFEAVRLADHESVYHQEAASRMGVSRQTFGRIIASARGKIAEALVNGRALRIAGGTVTVDTDAGQTERNSGNQNTPREG